MLICDAEVPGGFRNRLCIKGFIQGGGIRESLHLAINHRRDRQFIQFFVRQFRLVLLVLLLLPQCILELLLVDNLIVP